MSLSRTSTLLRAGFPGEVKIYNKGVSMMGYRLFDENQPLPWDELMKTKHSKKMLTGHWCKKTEAWLKDHHYLLKSWWTGGSLEKYKLFNTWNMW